MIAQPQKAIRNRILKTTKKVAVPGGGSWATALVKLLTENKRNVLWYMRNEQAIEQLQKWGRNPHYLPGAQLKKKRLSLSNDLNSIVEAADLVILCIPAAFLDGELQKLKQGLKDKIVVSAVKGVIPENLQIVGDYLHNQWLVPYNQIRVIAGPSHAEEVARKNSPTSPSPAKIKNKRNLSLPSFPPAMCAPKSPTISLALNMPPC